MRQPLEDREVGDWVSYYKCNEVLIIRIKSTKNLTFFEEIIFNKSPFDIVNFFRWLHLYM